MMFLLYLSASNGVAPKPNTTLLHLLNNFLFRTNFRLQTTINNKVETELQTFNYLNAKCENAVALSHLLELFLWLGTYSTNPSVLNIIVNINILVSGIFKCLFKFFFGLILHKVSCIRKFRPPIN